MRVIVQRAKQAKVTVAEQTVAAIDQGLLVLVGFTHTDSPRDLEYVAEKIVNLRIFEDEAGKMNHSLLDTSGGVLSVSQFTLYGDTRKGRRPNFMEAAKPVQAKVLYDQFNEQLRQKGVQVATGEFGAHMDVSFTNDGPVTLIVESLNEKRQS